MLQDSRGKSRPRSVQTGAGGRKQEYKRGEEGRYNMVVKKSIQSQHCYKSRNMKRSA